MTKESKQSVLSAIRMFESQANPIHNSDTVEKIKDIVHFFYFLSIELTILEMEELLKEWDMFPTWPDPEQYRDELQGLETRYCVCGCGETFKCLPDSKKMYIPHHHNRLPKHLKNKRYGTDLTKELKHKVKLRDEFTCQLRTNTSRAESCTRCR